MKQRRECCDPFRIKLKKHSIPAVFTTLDRRLIAVIPSESELYAAIATFHPHLDARYLSQIRGPLATQTSRNANLAENSVDAIEALIKATPDLSQPNDQIA